MDVINSEKLCSILIVDDILFNIRVLADMLNSEYDILFATDGKRALELALENQPDLIILDVVMPDMSGYEVCQKLQSNPLTNKIPVVFITASLSDESEVFGFEQGAIDYLRKPFRPSIVKARVRNHIKLKIALEENLRYAENLILINEKLKIEIAEKEARAVELDIANKELHARHIAKQKLTTKLLQFKVGIDNLSTGVTIADNNRIVLYVNSSAVQLFNKIEANIQHDLPMFNVETLVGTSIDLFHKNSVYQKELLATFESTVEVNMPLGGHIMNIKASPIFDGNGGRLGSVAEWRDITEEEIRLTELTQSYEKNNVLNQQVNHMQKLESIGRLTSGIAHDFNNILCCMLGFNEMTQYASEDIQDKALRDEIENNVKQVDLAGNRAKELINKMLTYCRQDTQKSQMEIKPTKLVIQEVLEMLKPALTSRVEIKMQLECDEIIQIDAIDLHQILTNLAVNARDAMKERGSFISISLKKITNVSAYCLACASVIQGDFIELSVTDNGSGIEPEIVSRIFDPFFTTKAQGEGTGLGLSTVSGIVHQSLGHILIDSNSEEKTHGTSFRMLFPR